jgi:glutamate carboxypeptidase
VSFNPDEEVGSIGSGEIIAGADQHDVVVLSRRSQHPPPRTTDSARRQRTATGTMEVKGKASHAGAAPQLGRNALIELAHQLLQTQDVAKSIPGTQLNWTTAKAGAVRQIPTRPRPRRYPPHRSRWRAKAQAALDESEEQADPRHRNHREDRTGPTSSVATADPAVCSPRKDRQSMRDRAPARHRRMTGGATCRLRQPGAKAVVVESFGLAGWGLPRPRRIYRHRLTRAAAL